MGDRWEEEGLEDLFHRSWAGGGRDDRVGGMGGAEGTEEVLGADEGEVVLDGEDLGVRLKMALGGHLQRPSVIRMEEF